MFLELSVKMYHGILLTVSHDQSLYSLVFLHQKIFPTLLQDP